MTIKEQLTQDMKNAMKAREMDTLGTIRFLMAEIKNAEIDAGELDDAGMQKVIASQAKRIKDAMTDFEKAGRNDLVEAEAVKLKIFENYLPKQMSDEELQKVVKETIVEVGQENQGILIGAVMKKVAGQADGKRVADIIKAL